MCRVPFWDLPMPGCAGLLFLSASISLQKDAHVQGPFLGLTFRSILGALQEDFRKTVRAVLVPFREDFRKALEAF